MASSISLKSTPGGIVLDSAGNALNGRSMFVYQPGTAPLQPQPIFSDAGLTVPLSQPVVTGSDGTAGAIPGFVAAQTPVVFYDVLSGATIAAEPVSALDMQNLQAAVQDLTPAGVTTNIITAVGNLGAAYPLDLSPALETIMGIGILNADCVITVTGLQEGTTADLLLQQDATGGRALTFVVGTATIVATSLIPAGANAGMRVSLYSMDGATLFVTGENAAVGVSPVALAAWTGTIAPLVAGQLDPTVWPYQSVAAGHMTVVADPVKGNVIALAITETG